jgi:hypothetical protein
VSKTLKIVGLGGSLADNSKSRAALQTALDGAASAGGQPVANGMTSKAAQTHENRCRGLPPVAAGVTWHRPVRPPEGSAKYLQNGSSLIELTCTILSVR